MSWAYPQLGIPGHFHVSEVFCVKINSIQNNQSVMWIFKNHLKLFEHSGKHHDTPE